MLIVAKRPRLVVSAALLIAVISLMLAEATGSTPARWYALLIAVVVIGGALVMASRSVRRLSIGVAVSALVVSVFLFGVAILSATGAWSPGSIIWEQPGWGVVGGVFDVVAIAGSSAIVMRLWRGVQGGPGATALALGFILLAVVGSYLIARSVSFAYLREVPV